MMLTPVRTLIAATLVAVAVIACSSRELEISATEPVEILLLPNRPDVEGNKKIGVLPAGSTVAVKREILGKDLAAYEVEYVDSQSHAKVAGYVLLGSPGLQVRIRRAGT